VTQPGCSLIQRLCRKQRIASDGAGLGWVAKAMADRQSRSRWLRPSLIALVAGAVSLVSSAVVTASAAGVTGGAAASGSSLANVVITAFSQPGATGNGVTQEFDATNASFTGTATGTGINLAVSGGTAGLQWTFVVEPPSGTSFRLGYYSKVQWAPTRTAGFSGIDISDAGSGCTSNSLTGGFDVRDLAGSGSAITRLDLLYEVHCDSLGPALFGEIRIGEPKVAGLIVSSRSIAWPGVPGTGYGGHGTAVTIYVRNPGRTPVPIGTVALQGYGAENFGVVDDTCSGATLPPGFSCSLFLRFFPSTRGPRPAVLRLPLGTRVTDIQLDALVRPGTTSLTMNSQPGDYIGQGQNYDLTLANTVFTLAADRSGIEAFLTTGSDVPWTVDIVAPAGQALADGTYLHAAEYPGNGNSPGLSVYGDSRGCNSITGSFKIKQIAFSAADGSLRNFDGTFTQYCDNDTGALTGELKYDAEPVTGPPPGVSALTATAAGAGIAISWANPASSGYRYTLVRIIPSGSPAGLAPYAGFAVYAGSGTNATAHGLVKGDTYTVAAYAVDQYGNVSAPAETQITF
jgi:hypothetical protein